MRFPFINSESRLERQEVESQNRQMDFQREQQIMAQADAVETPGQTEDLMRWQQDLHDELVVLVHRLRNESWDGRKWTKRYDRNGNPLPPLMNEHGIAAVEAQVSPLISRNMINSNFKEEDILMMLQRTANSLNMLFAEHYDTFEINPSATNMNHIIRLIINIIKPAPYRALNDGERKHQRTVNKRIEAFNETVKPQTNSNPLSVFGFTRR